MDWVILSIIWAQRESESLLGGGGGSLETEEAIGGGGGSLEAEEATGRGGTEGISVIEINSACSKASGVR
jgi:hypothetical protein